MHSVECCIFYLFSEPFEIVCPVLSMPFSRASFCATGSEFDQFSYKKMPPGLQSVRFF